MKCLGEWKSEQVDGEGIHEKKVTFDSRPEGSEEANPTEVWGKSTPGGGNSQVRAAMGGAHLACLGKEDSEARAQRTGRRAQEMQQRGYGVGVISLPSFF